MVVLLRPIRFEDLHCSEIIEESVKKLNNLLIIRVPQKIRLVHGCRKPVLQMTYSDMSFQFVYGFVEVVEITRV